MHFKSFRLSLGLLLILASGSKVHAVDLFVATDGNDANAATQASPLKTLDAARDAVRRWRKTAPANDPVTVWIKGGRYPLTQSLELDERDSGSAATPVTYRTVKGEQVDVVGSVHVPLDQIKVVIDPAILQRLLPEVRGKVVEADLKKLGVTDFGSIGPRGFGWPYVAAPLEVFVNSMPLSIARWPKAGEPAVPIGKVLDAGSNPRKDDLSNRGGTFTLETDRPSRWAAATDVWISGLFRNGYADATLQIAKFDLQKRTITTVQPSFYGFGSGHPWNTWYALNLLEEIQNPGEYCLDRSAGKLYFLPPGPLENSDIELSMLDQPLVQLSGASYIHFESITFECSRGIGIYIDHGESDLIANCTLRNLGVVGVCIGQGTSAGGQPVLEATGTPVTGSIGSLQQRLYADTVFNRQGGRNHIIQKCEIYDTGAGGVSLGGGDRKTLAPANNAVINCDIHDFNRWDRAYRPAVAIDGVGNRIANCHLHNCPGSAILLHGNDHIIEQNEIDHAVLDADDMGAFYMGRDPSERGTVLRNNYWHDIGMEPREGATHAIYIDDGGGNGTTIVGNVFRNAGKHSTVFLNGGSDFTVNNNVFVDCNTAVYMSSALLGFAKANLAPHGLFEQRCEAVNFQQPPWSTHYPGFPSYFEDHPGIPKGNVASTNLFVGCKKQCAGAVKYLKVSDNQVLPADAALADTAKLTAELQSGSELTQKIPEFEAINLSKIGIQNDGVVSPGSVAR